MKPKTVALLILSATLNGCQNLDKLINGKDAEPIPSPEILSSVPELGDAPNFNVPTPDGTTRLVFHGLTPSNGLVSIQDDAGSTIRVFVKVRGDINQWFVVGPLYSGAFWYERNGATVQYHGNLANTEFCIYQYVAQ